MPPLGITEVDRGLWGRQLEGRFNSKMSKTGESQLSVGSRDPLQSFSVAGLGQRAWHFNITE